MWCGNHWQPVSCDTQTTEDKVHTVNSVCVNCQHHLNDAKGLLDELTSLQLHSVHSSSDCGSSSSSSSSSDSSNILQQYSRSLEYEEKLINLFDNTVTITAKEDLLHSLR